MNKSITSPISLPVKSATKRTPVSKGRRFDVFKRDAFTCQYCGAQPPDAVLVVDHITPVSAGGTNDLTNLISACSECNAGKSAKLLTERVVRPDAELMYLETQQEIAEIRRYHEAIAEKEQAFADYISVLQDVWVNNAGTDWHPSDHLLRKLLRKYDFAVIEHALEDVAIKVEGGYIPAHGDAWVRYLWGVAKHTANGFEEE